MHKGWLAARDGKGIKQSYFWVFVIIQLSTDSIELSDGESTESSETKSEGLSPKEKDDSDTESDNDEVTGNVKPTVADKCFMAEVSLYHRFRMD